MLTQVLATRYVSPLREGGSLPGLVEADDCGTYVVKFRGAGQGSKALVAEVIVGELGRRIGLRVPDLRIVDLDPAIARYEADEEVQDLLNASVGLNLGVDFLPGALGYDGVSFKADPREAATLLWLDGFVANVDRSWQNPNLLLWHKQLWCIDHGASLYFHHSWGAGAGDWSEGARRFAAQPYAFDKHIMNAYLAGISEADERLSSVITEALLAEVVAQVPDTWLESPASGGQGAAPPQETVAAAEARSRYAGYLSARLQAPRRWLPEVS